MLDDIRCSLMLDMAAGFPVANRIITSPEVFFRGNIHIESHGRYQGCGCNDIGYPELIQQSEGRLGTCANAMQDIPKIIRTPAPTNRPFLDMISFI